MSVTIKIKETGKIETITLIDPKSNLCWASDYIGNAINSDEYEIPGLDDDDCDYIMGQKTYDWWKNQCAAYQAADEKLHETRQAIIDSSDLGSDSTKLIHFDYDYHNYINGYDFNVQPAAIKEFCEKYSN